MSKIRQILRLHSQGESKLGITRLTNISRNTLKKYIHDYEQLALTSEDLESLTDANLDELFGQFRCVQSDLMPTATHLMSLFPEIDKQLKRKGVTLRILWEAYKSKNPEGYQSSQFNHYYHTWKQQVNPTMHVEHKAGDKLFVDYAGEKLHLVDPVSGEIIPVEVFVAILGCSQLTYVEASYSQQKEDLIASCERALHFIGGVPAAIVTDNLKSAVTKSSKYEPVLNERFVDFASHYNLTVLPTRAYKPKDKALVEGAVKIIYTRIYAKLSSKYYNSLDELNKEIRIHLDTHNNMFLQGRNYSRALQFNEIEAHTLHKLPVLKYEFKDHAHVTVMKNGHICLGIDKHYYSVPYRFISKKVKLLYSNNSIEIFYNYERIAVHQRIKSPYSYTTVPEHLASTHRFVSEWTPERFLNWAADIDEAVRFYVFQVLSRKQHVEQAYKACLGILSMAKKYNNERLINACKRGVEYDMYSYKAIDMILTRGLDKPEPQDEQPTMPTHPNIRGKSYYK